MSDDLPEIPTPETNDSGPDIFTEMLETNTCPLCHIPLESKTHDQWVRTYGATEVWLTDVHFFKCPKCESSIYPDETIQYFERARAGEIPDLKIRAYEVDEYDDDEEEAS